jgi:hypothetical protein
MSRPAHCPNPEKRAYRDGEQAAVAAERMTRTVGVPMFAYACRCESWHLTKRPTRGSVCPTCGTVQS